MELDKVYVTGNGRISDYFIGLGMRPFTFSGEVPENAVAIIWTDFAEPLPDHENSDIDCFRSLARLSLECLIQKIPLVFISNDLVFGDGDNFSESRTKNPKTARGMLLLVCEAIIKIDGHKTIRVSVGQIPTGICSYLENLRRVPQTLHLGDGGKLSVAKARRIKIHG